MFETTLQGTPVELASLDAEWLLELAGESEVAARAADRRKLRLAAQWCVLHEVSAPGEALDWSAAPGVDCDETIGGEGAPLVADFCAEPFAAALGVSTMAGLRWLSNALDLQHRLRRIWRLVEELEVPAWKARRVADLTHGLSLEAAEFVDAELAPLLATRGMPTVDRVVAAAIARFHPDLAAQKEKRGKAGWGVHLHHPGPDDFAGTSFLDASGDTLDLSRFRDVVVELAHRLGEAGDPDTFEQRKAKALGLIADLHEGADLDELLDRVAASAADGGSFVAGSRPRPRRRPVTIHVHVGAADLRGTSDPVQDEGTCRIADVDRFGPATMDLVADWAGRHGATVQPVVDLARVGATDSHDPPPWMAEQVRLRDRHCVFPWCERDSRRCDLDHIAPYRDDGSSGQTDPDNLAPLCRRHHRCKTHGRWRYRRNHDGSYSWRSPQGATYLVTTTGTAPLGG